jgi:hypothetical protein
MGEHEGGDTVLRRQSSGGVHLVQGRRYRPGVDEVIGARAGSETGNMSGIITGESIALRFRWRAIGDVALDFAAKLVFPQVTAEPAYIASKWIMQRGRCTSVKPAISDAASVTTATRVQASRRINASTIC